MHAALRELKHLLDRGIAARHNVSRTEVPGELQLRGIHVNRDDARRSGELCPLHDIEADATATDYGDALAGTNAGGVHGRADAGQYRATQESRDIERHVLW